MSGGSAANGDAIGPPLHAVDLAGRAYLDAATDLLLKARGDDPMAGLYEAGDLQWWWKDEANLASRRATFWLDAAGEPVACLLLAEQGPRQNEPGAIDADLIWRPSRDQAVRAAVFPTAIDRLAALGRASAAPVCVSVHEADGDLRHRLAAIGFRYDPDEDLLQMAQRPSAAPAPLPLPAGMRFADDRDRPPGRRHHLAARNGEHVADRLRECSLYRPDLDLRVETETGEVAAYCLCWLDPVNAVGHFEPVRTEAAFQRRGIGRALLTEGIRRLWADGARLIKVAHAATNEAARGLYEGVGFAPAFRELRYCR